MTTTTGTNCFRSYHFSLGNSTDGSVGYCARVIADSTEAAVDQLRALLEGMNREQRAAAPNEPIEYLVVYFNPAAVTAGAIDEVNELDAPLDLEEVFEGYDH